MLGFIATEEASMLFLRLESVIVLSVGQLGFRMVIA